MEIHVAHRWDVSPEEAVALQDELRRRVILADDFGEARRVAGVDVGFRDEGRTTRAAIAVLSFPDLRPVEQAIAEVPTTFPYVPGLLSFREIPAVLAALGKLATLPDLLLCDGQGIAHPRRFGIASHLGVVCNLPTVGVAKSLLVGRHGALADERGASSPLVHRNETVGAALRTRPGVAPVYVSPGHRVSLPTALRLVMACTTRYRLPETTRAAHRLASESREGAGARLL